MNRGYMNVIHAGRYPTLLTDKMHMIIVVVSVLAFFFAQSVLDRIVRSGNRMDDSLFHKCLECPVNGNPVVTAGSPRFQVMMCQGLARLDENIQDAFPTVRNTELVTPQYRCYLVLHTWIFIVSFSSDRLFSQGFTRVFNQLADFILLEAIIDSADLPLFIYQRKELRMDKLVGDVLAAVLRVVQQVAFPRRFI